MVDQAQAFLSALAGEWRGEGEGEWPSEPPFRYLEHASFLRAGRPFLSYSQRTFGLPAGEPRHQEVGYLRVGGDGEIEWLVVQPTGFAEISRGRPLSRPIDGPGDRSENREAGDAAGGVCRFELSCSESPLLRAPHAIPVRSLRRQLVLLGDRLEYTLEIAVGDEPLSPHLRARLERVSDTRADRAEIEL